jgi:hypothetical protein
VLFKNKLYGILRTVYRSTLMFTVGTKLIIRKLYRVLLFNTCTLHLDVIRSFIRPTNAQLNIFNPLNAELNPICHLHTLLKAHHVLHVSRIRVKTLKFTLKFKINAPTCFGLTMILIYFLTATGLPHGGSSTVHIYTKQYIEQHK